MAERVPEKDLDDPAVWKQEGDRFFQRGDYEAASMNYVRAIELNPEYLDAWNSLSAALRKMGRTEEAGRAMHFVKDLQGEGPGEAAAREPPLPEETGHETHPPDYARLERDKKSPAVAGVVAFFFAGLGQIYNGQNFKGFLILAGTIFGLALLIIPGVVIWLFGIYDAYTTAKKMRYGKITYEPTNLLFVMLYFALLIVIVLVLAAAILSIFAGLDGASPLSLLNISAHPGDPQGRNSMSWVANGT
ncbi:TM2 domain-containing membrane protein YozV [Methanolinea mesophila]|uniref:tetratricopeptide repeat protein n=1 Tax=Methanolinea mesophila TaxID=547055 RepID=UPI001AE3C074|nr:tetratricopeptide repeat protein [Methanolinea mesophila]MBP1928134.1 TM2 domain-containing membrane protein YozV [Methanolinea mesophila]